MPQSRRRNGRLVWLAAVAVLVTAVAVLWRPGGHDEAGAVARMGASERRALFAKEMASFTEICTNAARDPRLRKRCRERAEFIVVFPECDSSCRYIADSVLPGATR